MKIIVLTITQYKEKDGIIFGLSEDGVNSYSARGIFDPKNKNASINNPLTIADIELGSDRYKYPVIKNSKVLFSPYKVNNDYHYLGILSLLVEVTKKLLQEDEMKMMYKHLESAIKELKKTEQPWMIALIYLFNIFKATGYEFQANECVFCGSRTNITSFSFREGGFICKDCFKSEMDVPFNSEQMLLLREAYFAKNYKYTSEHCNKINALKILEKCNEYIVDSFGLGIDSIAFLNK